MTYRIYGTARHSTWELSNILRSLRVSHTVTTTKKTVKVNLGHPQPRHVHVTDELEGYRKGAVNFIVSSLAQLQTTNYFPLDANNLTQAVKAALLSKETLTPEVAHLSAMDYVNMVAKPSLLNKIQTEIYRITPYALRKQTQQIVLDYLNSRLSKKGVKNKLSSNLKLEGVLELVLSADSLRDAVARLSSETVEQVAADTGHPTFELLYLSKTRK